MITGDGDASETHLLDAVGRALAAGVDYVQLRRKRGSARELEALANEAARRFPSKRRRILVNDRLDVALAARLGGVHLPADGLPIDAVRSVVPKSFLIGRSTHDREEVVRAAEAGASFVVYGPIFPTASKPGHPGVGLESLARAASSAPIPVLALGGITPERVSLVSAAGAAGVAGISVFEREESLEALLSELRRVAPRERAAPTARRRSR